MDEYQTMKTAKKPTKILSLFIALAGLTVLYTQSAIATENPPRLSTSTYQNTTTKNHYPSTSTKTEDKSRTIQTHNDHGLWIYDVQISLNTDNDNDGLYSTFSVSVDIDSSYNPRTVYAVLYLRTESGPWLEYAVTNSFIVTGTGSADAVAIETNLESGYPGGYYDHYIEVYDAYDDSLLITYGPDQSRHVFGLPFESDHHDIHYTYGYQYNSSGGYGYYGSSANVSVSFTGSGSTTLYSLLGLLALVFYKRRFSQRS